MADPTIKNLTAGQPGQATAVTSREVLAAQRVIDMDKKIYDLEPSATPLTVLSQKMGKTRTVTNPEYSWLERVLLPKTVTNAGAACAADGTTLAVVTGQGVKCATGDILINPANGEHIRVVSVSTDNVTIERGFGTTAAAIIAADAILLIAGNAQAEGASLTQIRAVNSEKITNYTQIFRTPCGATRTLIDSKLYGGDYMSDQHRINGIIHATDIERAFLFGEAKESLSGAGVTAAASGPIRTTAGIDAMITTIKHEGVGALTYPAWVGYMQEVFRYGNQKTRLGLCAPVVCSALDIMAFNKQLQMQESNILGVDIKKIQSSHGTILLAKHNLLSEHASYNERMYVIDMDNFWKVVFTGANTKLLQGRQANDVDGKIDEYLSELGTQLVNEETCAKITGISLA